MLNWVLNTPLYILYTKRWIKRKLKKLCFWFPHGSTTFWNWNMRHWWSAIFMTDTLLIKLPFSLFPLYKNRLKFLCILRKFDFSAMSSCVNMQDSPILKNVLKIPETVKIFLEIYFQLIYLSRDITVWLSFFVNIYSKSFSLFYVYCLANLFIVLLLV